ncbi:MAG: SBBP repeat-containing protein [Chloroflexi bacterium]|nr:SBBP repeat-containing protein [Chloroflexota bacterium]
MRLGRFLVRRAGRWASSPWSAPGCGRPGFHLGAYDPARPLVIDPVLVYSTYLGGNCFDAGNGMAVDPAGNAYVAGTTGSTDFRRARPLQASFGGGSDAFVTKIAPTAAPPSP